VASGCVSPGHVVGGGGGAGAGCGVGDGQVALASITEPSGHVCCGGLLSAGGGVLSGAAGPCTGGGILACAIREPRAEVKSTNITKPDIRQERFLFTGIIATLV
jgi:hypothetical protein